MEHIDLSDEAGGGGNGGGGEGDGGGGEGDGSDGEDEGRGSVGGGGEGGDGGDSCGGDGGGGRGKGEGKGDDSEPSLTEPAVPEPAVVWIAGKSDKHCRYGNKCKNKGCKFAHPTTWQHVQPPKPPPPPPPPPPPSEKRKIYVAIDGMNVGRNRSTFDPEYVDETNPKRKAFDEVRARAKETSPPLLALGVIKAIETVLGANESKEARAAGVEYLPMALVAGLPTAIEAMQEAGVWVVGLDAGGPTPIHDLTVADSPVCLVLGAEGKGLSKLVRQRCDVLASIPLHGRLASLNVASAGAIACYEVARRRV